MPSSAPTDALDVALLVAAALDSAGCEYFVGGSVASPVVGVGPSKHSRYEVWASLHATPHDVAAQFAHRFSSAVQSFAEGMPPIEALH